MRVEDVRELVLTVLEQAPGFDGRTELLSQVPLINIAGGPVSMVRLDVDRECPPAPVANGPVPGACWAWAEDGSPLGTLLVWVEDGYLATLELGWVTDDPLAELPPPSRLTTDAGTPPDTAS